MAMDTWVIVLAGGEGSRLRSLTLDERGDWVPKQFCSLRGGPSLLEESVLRARAVAPPERTLVVVARRHRRFWQGQLAHLPAENVIEQPDDRGTAAGLLLPLLAVLERDPRARVVLLPADHHVQREPVLAAALRIAVRQVEVRPFGRPVVLLGMVPEAAESQYGWIVPRPEPGFLHRVEAFVEKPPAELAQRLLRSGALWSSFVLVARGHALLRLLERRLPQMVKAFRASLGPHEAWSDEALAELYGRIVSADLSRDVLQGAEEDLLVLEVPPCGWTDLGTPERVRACLAAQPEPPLPARASAPLVLARRFPKEAGSFAGAFAG